jgi:hypothetical protein
MLFSRLKDAIFLILGVKLPNHKSKESE